MHYMVCNYFIKDLMISFIAEMVLEINYGLLLFYMGFNDIIYCWKAFGNWLWIYYFFQI